MNGRIFQLNCSDGGVPKLAVREAFLTPTGLEGDRQRDLRFHGGPERALCLYPLERILELQAEGHPIFPGSIGENVTVVGLDWGLVEPGARLALGDEVLVEISDYAGPCKNIKASFRGGDYLVWDLQGNVTLKFTNTGGGGNNAVLSGLFFGSPPSS